MKLMEMVIYHCILSMKEMVNISFTSELENGKSLELSIVTPTHKKYRSW
jgi:hypothetical protein